jgi:hypothetical protein
MPNELLYFVEDYHEPTVVAHMTIASKGSHNNTDPMEPDTGESVWYTDHRGGLSYQTTTGSFITGYILVIAAKIVLIIGFIYVCCVYVVFV